MNNMDQALSDLNSSVRLNPKFGLAYYTRGILKAEVKDFRGAIDDYGSAIALNPNDTDARYMRAEAKINMNDQNGAILDLNKTLEINPDHVNASRLLYRLNQSSSQNGGTDPGDPVRTMELLDARNAANQGNLYPMQMYKKKYGSSY
jgi:tetratricopeptide (TPR) repeat protein